MAKQKKTKKISHVLFQSILIVAMGFLLFVLGLSIVKEVKVTIDLNKEISNKQEELASLSEKRQELEEQKANFEDDTYVEQYARGKYKLTKEGEKIYKLPGKETTQQPEE